jgi:hypothetical protein
MNLQELKADLNSKTKYNFFNVKLFTKDQHIYKRRSFKDLFIYYRKYKVSEVMLMKALYETGFSTRTCNTINKYVFFKYYEQKSNSIFSIDPLENSGYGYPPENTKYTKEYLTNLFNKAMKYDEL